MKIVATPEIIIMVDTLLSSIKSADKNVVDNPEMADRIILDLHKQCNAIKEHLKSLPTLNDELEAIKSHYFDNGDFVSSGQINLAIDVVCDYELINKKTR